MAVLGEATLRLEPVPVSARKARGFVRNLLVKADREQWCEQAELAVSEVVTNVVLHAHTALLVTVRIRADELLVEVLDASPQLPLHRVRGTHATTGRGLDLVAAVTADCGVRTVPTGKVVWFVVRGTEPEPTGPDPLSHWDLPDLPDQLGEPASVIAPPGQVLLLGLPPRLWLAAVRQHEAMLREYTLYSAEHPVEVPVETVTRAGAARRAMSVAVLAAIDLLQARGELPAALDVVVPLPADSEPGFTAVRQLLDAAERLALSGQLLVNPALPEITALRNWACDEALAQLAGSPPRPWPGVLQEHFLTQVDVDPQLNVDLDEVTASQRRVVAADEANRIVAISAPLADWLGWRPGALLGRRLVALVPPAMREAHVVGFSRFLTTGESHILGRPLHLPVLRADGTEVGCDMCIRQAEGPGGRVVFIAEITPTD